MEENKMFNMFKRINYTNSTTTVQCNARGVCRMRFSSACDNCKHNCGMKEDKIYFKPKKNIKESF